MGRLTTALFYTSLALAAPVLPVGLAACGHSNGNNGNNTTLKDGSVDATGLDATTDASVLDDGGLPLANCITEGREGFDDSYLELKNPDNDGDCYALAMSYNELQNEIMVLCSFPNNRLLQFTPGASPELEMRHRVTDSAPAPEDSETAEVHPRGVLMFSPDGAKQLAVVPYQQVNPSNPANVKGGLYLYDADALQLQLVQDRSLAVRVVSGGDPDGTVFTFTDPVGAAFAQGRIWVAPENLDPETGEPIVSDIVGSPLVDRGGGLWILDDEVSLSSPDGMGYRPTAVAKINDTLLAGVFNGVAAANSTDWKRPKFGVFDASSAQTFNDALLTIDDVGLTHDWQFVSLPGVAKTSDDRTFVHAAENPSTGRYRVISIHVDDLSDVENSSHSVASFDLPAELANPARREGSDDPEMIPTGPVANIVINGSRAYVTTAGDGEHYGFMFVFDVNLSNGAMTPVGVGGLGINPGPSIVAPGSVAGTKSVYQYVERANCGPNKPYVIEIEPDDVAWGSI